MVFSSWQFLFVFLPATLALYWATHKIHQKASLAVLVVASLVFYSSWRSEYLVLILLSCAFNYGLGSLLQRIQDRQRLRLTTLVFGVSVNLTALVYYKYWGFLLDNLAQIQVIQPIEVDIVLPLAISFFTFQQIAFLHDIYKRKSTTGSVLNYLLFVTFFPQLIAGPIVHHEEMMPQFDDRTRLSKIPYEAALTCLAIGLFKKLVIADSIGPSVSEQYALLAEGKALVPWQRFIAFFGYPMQLYFDFSGYCDMAQGVALLFGITLPLNFNSPYRAANIIDFWRRWHMTLSRFLRDYLYIQLGGNRYGKFNRFRNLLLTMLLGGLWHGAGWGFVIWGALHGGYLIINHAAKTLKLAERADSLKLGFAYRIAAQGLTLLGVYVAWVFFRAGAEVNSARALLRAIARSPITTVWEGIQGGPGAVLVMIGLATIIALIFPNTNQILGDYHVSLHRPKTEPPQWLQWKPQFAYQMVSGVFLAASCYVLIYFQDAISEFIYYQF